VPYQPLLPDAVKIRGQVASGLQMAELQPVRVRDNDGDGLDDPSEAVAVPYVFAVPDGVDPASVVVTARMRFRHLPPYFVHDLEARQQGLGDDGVPEGAQIDAGALLEFMVVSDIVEATSDDAEEQLECPGPQNGELSILECIDEGDLAGAAERLGFGSGDGGGQFERGGDEDDEQGLGAVPTGGELALWGPLGMALLVPVAGARRRSRAR
jgi:hypothetical protein